jgi:cobalt-zinc-cadmium efflux system outer membrane protein
MDLSCSIADTRPPVHRGTCRFPWLPVLPLLLAVSCSWARGAQEPPAADQVQAQGPVLTLDQAIGRLRRENLQLRAARDEIPQAQADAISAGSRAPRHLQIAVGKSGLEVLRYEPLEIVPRRWARALVARRAEEVLAAQYEDAERTQIGNLFTAYVDLQTAELHVRFAEASLKALEQMHGVTKTLFEKDQATGADLARLTAQWKRAASARDDAERALRSCRLVLANLLNMNDAEAESLKIEEVRMSLKIEEVGIEAPALPPVEELIRMALRDRPDLRAYRLGLRRARADVILAWVEQMPEIGWLSWFDRRAAGVPGQDGNATSRKWGLLFRIPDGDGGRGKIARARINVGQTETELAAQEQKVILEVRQAEMEERHCALLVQRVREEILPASQQTRDDSRRLYAGGEVSLTAYLGAERDYNDSVVEYRDALIRLRRSVLALNTAIGQRLFP